jgi:hypothetical protein
LLLDFPLEMSYIHTMTYDEAIDQNADVWVPGCGGIEVPQVTREGTFLYVYNPFRDEHGWLNCETDIVQLESPYVR